MPDAAPSTVQLVLCTCPDDAVAARIAQTLVDEHLAACVNRIPGLVSTYSWQGRVCNDAEVLLVIKTTTACFAALQARIVELHPYELPEVIAVNVAQGLDRYLHWVAEAVAAPAAS